MLKSVEAQIDPSGEVKLLEPLDVDRPCRAVVTVIDDEGREVSETALLSGDDNED